MDLFDLYAKITLDTNDYENDMGKAGKSTESFASKIKNGLVSAAKVGAAALSAAAAGVAALTKASIENYAEYEQLVGGIETLFRESSDAVLQYADEAYKTAGMSANDYMETATSFAASLVQGLGGDTAEAAEYANRAITDMSDNANKMGTDITMIQNAYQGFAKQNYTMLDNLKLGYGGTQEEMQRLIADAAELVDIQEELGITVDANSMSFDNIVNAISVVQKNMGIMGTTAAEASSTIQGSISSMRAAWTNFITGMADPTQDFNALLGNLVDSVVTVGNNLIPRIQELLPRLAEGLTQLVQGLLPYIPTTLQTLLPTLIDGATSLINGFVNGFVAVLPDIITTAVSAIPQLVTAAGTIVSNLVTSLIEAAPQIVSAGTQLLDQFTTGIEQGLPDMISRIPEIITQFLDYITSELPTILDKGVELLQNLTNGIIGAIPKLVAALPQVISAFTTFVAQNLPEILDAGGRILLSLISGIIGAIPDLVAALPQIVSAIVNGIGSLMGSIINIGKNIVQGVWQGISNAASWLVNKVKSFFSGIVNSVLGFLGIRSPSRVFANIGQNMALGIGEGWDDEYGKIRKDIESGMNFGTASVDFASSGLGRSQASMSGALSRMAATMGQNFTITVQSVLDGKVIGESAYQYSRNKQRAYGV